MKSEFLIAVTQLAAERNLPQDVVVEAVEAALASAYKKDNTSAGQSISVRLDPNTGEIDVYQLKTVVEEVTEPADELTVAEAKKEAKALGWTTAPVINDILEFKMELQITGRIAAQTAKQVVIQRLREAERELVYGEFSEREGEVFTASIQRSNARYGGGVTLDLNGRAEAVLPPTEQTAFERYRPGQKLKVLILEVQRTNRGPEIVVSRSHPDLLRRLFEMEVPEIFNGIVEIRGIAREPGSRSKVAVTANQEGVDPVGACVGLRGIRIQNIVNELQGEKIDVIQWHRDPGTFISRALSPAQPLRVELDEVSGTATVVVSDRSLSLAIGREGQNARLAAKLSGWKVDIKSSTELEIERMKQAIEGQVAAQSAEESAAPLTAEVSETPLEVAAPVEVVAEVVEEATESAPPDAEAEVSSILEGVLSAEEAEVTALAELEAELAVEEAEAVKLSVEEALALEALGIDTIVPTEDLEVVVEEVIGSVDDIWKLPETSTDKPQIRFAEDILGGRETGGTGRGRRRGGRAASRPPGPRRTGPPGSAGR